MPILSMLNLSVTRNSKISPRWSIVQMLPQNISYTVCVHWQFMYITIFLISGKTSKYYKVWLHVCVSLILRNVNCITNKISKEREMWLRARIQRHWISTSHRNKFHALVRDSRLSNYNQVHTNIMTVPVFLPQLFGIQIPSTRLRVVPYHQLYLRALVL